MAVRYAYYGTKDFLVYNDFQPLVLVIDNSETYDIKGNHFYTSSDTTRQAINHCIKTQVEGCKYLLFMNRKVNVIDVVKEAILSNKSKITAIQYVPSFEPTFQFLLDRPKNDIDTLTLVNSVNWSHMTNFSAIPEWIENMTVEVYSLKNFDHLQPLKGRKFRRFSIEIRDSEDHITMPEFTARFFSITYHVRDFTVDLTKVSYDTMHVHSFRGRLPTIKFKKFSSDNTDDMNVVIFIDAKFNMGLLIWFFKEMPIGVKMRVFVKGACWVDYIPDDIPWSTEKLRDLENETRVRSGVEMVANNTNIYERPEFYHEFKFHRWSDVNVVELNAQRIRSVVTVHYETRETLRY
jgi:hypothetical protein